MRKFTIKLGLAGLMFFISSEFSHAQTLGYADALGIMAQKCDADIAKYCKTTSLGGGRMMKCLSDKGGSVSAACRTSIANMQALLTTRAQARAAVTRVCSNDIIRACPEVKPGDGNILDCYLKSKHLFTAACRKTVVDAGYEVRVDPNTPTTQVSLSSADLTTSVESINQTGALTAAGLKQMAAESLKDPSRTNRVNRAPLVSGLEQRSQLTIAINFDLNSARIRPDSFQAVGLMADALYHPYLQGYRFLVVGHTDATGNREHNLRLSQQRAEAIRAALINPFGIPPSGIEAVGLGEEQLLRSANPESGDNRRVQLINIGPAR